MKRIFLRTQLLLVGVVVIYASANIVAFICSNGSSVFRVFEIFGIWIPALLIMSTVFVCQVTGQFRPKVLAVFVVVVLIVAAVNIFFLWLRAYAK